VGMHVPFRQQEYLQVLIYLKLAITVAASDINDKLAYFSERGPCVDIIAPGVDIISTWNNGKTNEISGTSMATPHVVGVLALALSEGTFTSVQSVNDYITQVASKVYKYY
jgi:subtilisin family serine protease